VEFDMVEYPRKGKCAVVLTFDLDAETLWISRDSANLKRPIALSQGNYGPRVAIPRILKLLAKYDLKATFFIPGWVAEKYPEVTKEVHGQGHEIGHHGYLHEWPEGLSKEEETEILQKGTSILENLLGERPVGYRSPAWEFSPNTLKLLVEHSFLYSTNMMNDEIPYLHEIDGQKTDLVELPVSWLLDDGPFFLYSIRPVGGRGMTSEGIVYKMWKNEFDGIYNEGRCFVLTMHPQAIGRPGRLGMLEQLIRYMREFPGVWFTCAKELAKFWLEQGQYQQ